MNAKTLPGLIMADMASHTVHAVRIPGNRLSPFTTRTDKHESVKILRAYRPVEAKKLRPTTSNTATMLTIDAATNPLSRPTGIAITPNALTATKVILTVTSVWTAEMIRT